MSRDWLFAVLYIDTLMHYIGDDILPSSLRIIRDYFMSHSEDPYMKQTGFHGV